MLAQIRKDISKARTEENGFTLIELLLVVVIIGVLATIVVFSVGGIDDTSEEAACKADLKTVLTAQEAYRAQHPAYAASVAALEAADLLGSVPDTVETDTSGDVTGVAGADRDCSSVTL